MTLSGDERWLSTERGGVLWGKGNYRGGVAIREE